MHTSPTRFVAAQQHSRRHSFVPSVSGVHDALSPPSYQSSTREARSARRRSQQLPAYSQAIALNFQRQLDPDSGFCEGLSRQSHQHEFHIASGSGSQPWATLRVFSRSKSSQKCPKFFGGDTITGCVELDLEKPQTVNSITLSLRGRFITSSLEDGSFTFINQTITVWSKDLGDPRDSPLPSYLSGFAAATSKKGKFSAKLQGKYQWPFSLPFPTEVYLPHRNGGLPQQVIFTPQSFLERGINANIQYHLVMHVHHGLFRPNSKLQAAINYSPNIIPPPSSTLRQQAYREGGFLAPPLQDPAGWFSIPTIHFLRRFESNRSVDLRCTLWLAQPLSYTRGTVIPCFVTIQQASLPSLSSNMRNPSLNLASLFLSPSRPLFSILLHRRVTFLQDAIARSSVLLSQAPAGGVTVAEEVVSRGVWWRPVTAASNSGENESKGGLCHLEGEIHLPDDLQPSCQIGFFSVEYFAALVAHPHHLESILNRSNTSDLVSTSSSQPLEYLTTHPIQIATFHQEGPLPTPFTPPPNHGSLQHHHAALGGTVDSILVMMSRSRGRSDEVRQMEVFTRGSAVG